MQEGQACALPCAEKPARRPKTGTPAPPPRGKGLRQPHGDGRNAAEHRAPAKVAAVEPSFQAQTLSDGSKHAHARLRRAYDARILSHQQAIASGGKHKDNIRPTTVLRIPVTNLGEWFVGGAVETFKGNNFGRLSIKKAYKPKDATSTAARDYFSMDIPLGMVPKVIEHMLATALYDEEVREVVLGQLFQDVDFLQLIQLLQEKSELKADQLLVAAADAAERDQRMSGNESEDEPWHTFAGKC